MFESFVNSDRCKAKISTLVSRSTFESFVNSDRCKAARISGIGGISLRALLIQIGVKQQVHILLYVYRLRALLIQIGVKRP